MTDGEAVGSRAWRLSADVAAGLILFAGTAAVIWWQNGRLAVLYDLSGVLENAARISQGLVPYRDFPFPYAPLTFIGQAWLISWTGAVYWHHVVYACVVGGLASVLAWRVIYGVIADALPRPRLVAFLLALPTIVLGVYCVFPHPFYDPDAAFVILLFLWLLLCAERRAFPPLRTFLTGTICVVPLFIKQNIGLVLLGSIGSWLVCRIVVGAWKKWAIRPYLLLGAGIVLGLVISAAVLYTTVGIENYYFWTWTFARSQRQPSAGEMLAVYGDWWLLAWNALFLLGVWLYRRFSEGSRLETALSFIAMAVPFLWPVLYLLINPDPSERAERLIGLWPFIMIALVVLGYGACRRLAGIAAALPFILIATVHGVFLSQQLWGSTYAIWPLLMVMIALLLRQLWSAEEGRSPMPVIILVAVISASICTAGAFYLYSEERLDYIDWQDGELAASKLPQLSGLGTRGDFLPQFDELVAWTDQNIPRNDGVILLPGEDLFYYTTGRRPHFPVITFDYSYNPWKGDDLRERILASDVEWIIVKDDTQVERDATIDDKDAILESVKPAFRHIDDLDNYSIWKRRHAGDPPDDEDDGDDSGSDDEDSGD